MRSIQTYAAAAFLAMSVTTAASGQAGRPFRDSWFWGVSGGATNYYGYSATANPTLPGAALVAPVASLDWLITRTNGGLYVAYSQAFFSTNGVILNGPTAADSGYRKVQLDGLRRLEIMGMLFPGDFIRWHPYIGFGVSFKYLANAVAVGPFAGNKQIDYANSAVNDVKAGIGPAVIAGAQFRAKFMSVFGQAMVSSVGRDFLLANGHTANVSTQVGIRYNIGSSIDSH
jgi:hypothetical protein